MSWRETEKRLQELIHRCRLYGVGCGMNACGDCIECLARAASVSLQREERILKKAATERERDIVKECIAICESRASSHRKVGNPGWMEPFLEAGKCATAIKGEFLEYFSEDDND